MTVTYSANFCSGTPNGGNTVVSTPVACSGDTVDLSLSGNTTGLGLAYQWQSSPDGSTWTNMLNDTLQYASTAITNNVI